VTFLYSTGPLQKVEAPKAKPTLIESALDKVDLNDAWRHKIEENFDQVSQKIVALEKLLSEGHVQYSENVQEKEPSELSEEDGIAHSFGKEGVEAQADSPQIQELQEKLSQLETRLAEKGAYDPSSFGSPQEMGPHGSNGYNSNGQVEGNTIQKVTLGLTEGPHHKALNTPETTIPVGAFARTVLLSGLDASSAMNASSDPRPMLLRIVDHGTLPRRFQSDLKDCHLTAGAYGDLSSERVYARLEKLSCIDRFTGKIIELQVSGYVSGSDGKAGIRGVVASKDGQFLARSLMGGMFAGLSNVANPQNRRAQVNPFFGGGTVPGGGSQPSGPSIGETFMSGMAGGATTALDRLSQYYIDRAEQLQPVIQIAAGQVVDIVFTAGTSFLSNQLSVISHQNNKGETQNDSH
jgi:conjugal transfer pilus assembly protein TraB